MSWMPQGTKRAAGAASAAAAPTKKAKAGKDAATIVPAATPAASPAGAGTVYGPPFNQDPAWYISTLSTGLVSVPGVVLSRLKHFLVNEAFTLQTA